MTTHEPRLAVYQFSREEAIDMGSSRRWEALTLPERGLLQLRQDLLCMDMPAFYEGIAALLGRPVYTHELAKPDLLWEEYLGLREKPSFADIVGKLPPHLRDNMIVVVPEGGL